VPQNLAISEGFIITSDGDVSTQCDLIIYDPRTCPKLSDTSYQKFIPIESVIAIGEVKSKISNKVDMQEILNKLAKIKGLRDKVKTDPYKNYDESDGDHKTNVMREIFSFIIAKSLPPMPEIGFSYTSKIKPQHKHNIILGLDNGAASYVRKEAKHHCYCYPKDKNGSVSQAWYPTQENEVVPVHYTMLLTALSSHCQDAYLYKFDSVHYFTNNY